MNTKKLMAMLCAAAIASSTLVPVMASADETANLSEHEVLWSDTFDAYTNDSFGNGSISTLPVLVAATVDTRQTYEAIPGMTLYAANRADDSSYFLTEAVAEDAAEDLAVTTTISRFSTGGRGSYLAFAETYAPTEEKALVLSTKVKINADAAHTYLPGFKIGDMVITNDIMGVENNTWADLKIMYFAGGSYIMDVNGEEKGNGSTTASLSQMTFSALDSTGASIASGAGLEVKSGTHPYGYHTVSFDDMVVYLTDDVNAAAPEAVTQTPAFVATPEPTKAPEAAPAAEVPAEAQTIIAQNFNDAENVSFSLGTTGTYEAIGDVNVAIGARSSGADSTTYASVVENVEGDKMLKAVNGKFGHSGRAVRLEAGKEVKAADLGEGAYAALTFAAKLNPTDAYPATINICKDASTDSKSYLYTNVLATVTTDETATDGSIIVTADEWHVFEFFMFADGTMEFVVDGTSYSVTGTCTALPVICTYNGTAATYTGVDFDNITGYIVGDYTATADPTIPPVEPFPETTVDFTQDMSTLDASYSHYLGTSVGTYTDIEGLTYVIGGRGEGVSGDTTNVRVKTDDYANQYLYVETSRFGTNGRAPLFQVTGAPVLSQLATDEDYVAMSFAAKLIPADGGVATMAFPVVADYSTNGGYYIYNAATLTTDETSTSAYIVPADTWMLIDVLVDKTGAYQILVDGNEAASGTAVKTGGDGNETKTLTALPYITTNASHKDATYASFAIDNIVVSHTGELSEVVATPEPEAAPAVAADDGTSVVFSENFNGLENGTTKMSATESLSVELGAGLVGKLGSREGESSNEPQYTAVTVKSQVEGDKIVKLTGGKFGTATRAPRLAFTNSPDVTTMENDDDYIAMGFAFKLNSVANVTDQISALTLIANTDDTVVLDEEGNNTNSETKDDDSVYGYALASFTTNEADAVSGSVAAVTADEWHVAYVYIYKDMWYVYVDDAEVASGTTVNYTNSDKVSITKLPQILAAKNAKGVVSYQNVDIDNVIAYTSAVPTLANVAITAATAEVATITADADTTAKVIVASYDENGRMTAVTTQDAALTAGENTVAIAAAADDKVMAWAPSWIGSGVQPYCAAVTVQ